MAVTFNGDREALARYWRFLADWMGLRDWQFKLADDPPTMDASNPESISAAQIDFVHGRRYAVLFIAKDWMEWDEEELRQHLVHELVHCHLHGMTMALYNVQNLIPRMTMEVVEGAHRDANELATDGIAAAWADSLLLPIDWWRQVEEPPVPNIWTEEIMEQPLPQDDEPPESPSTAAPHERFAYGA